MLIRTLTLKDFGLFRGVTSLDLVPRVKHKRQRPIVLFGGKNGAGKSTLLEALRLCLYGRASLGDRVRLEDYHGYLAERIHRSPHVGYTPRSAEIVLEFEHVDVGVQHRYSITRSWQRVSGSGRDVEERVIVLRDGASLDDIDAEHWNDFIGDLVPPGLADLFFFDGEKIQRLAEGAPSAELSDSVRSLLGLNLVERLQADLDIYAARESRRHGDTTFHAQLDEIDALMRSQEESLEGVRQRNAQCRSGLDHLSAQAEQLRAALVKRGGGFASSRAKLETEAAEHNASLRLTEDRLREHAAGLLPFALCSSLCARLNVELETATAGASNAEHTKAYLRTAGRVFKSFVEGKLAVPHSLQRATRKAIASALSTAIEQEFGSWREKRAADSSSSTDRSQISDNLSSADLKLLLDWLNGVRELRSDLPEMGQHLEKAARRLQAIQVQLRQAPEEDVIGPLVTGLADVESRRGALSEQLQRMEEEESENERRVAVLRRQREKLLAEVTGRGEREGRLRQVQSIKNALRDYHARLTHAKVQRLQDEVASCFRRLCRKSDLVRELTIDPVTFEVHLKGANGATLPREQLSAGEKQIFAIALLWALARTSGRSLPIVIDTPLARLDKDHRQALFERYFPDAAHQVIVLSTDSEFDEQAFEMLRPSISHAYHLLYQHDARATGVEEGYFWRVEEHVPVEASAHSLLG